MQKDGDHEKIIGMNYPGIIKSIEEGKISPVYLLYGDEDFLISDILSKLKQKIFTDDPYNINIEILSGDEVSASDIIDKAETLPFLSAKRLIIVNNIDLLNSKDEKILIEYLTSPSPSGCLAFTASKVDSKKKIYSTIIKKYTSCKFNKLNKRELAVWVSARAREKGISLTKQALDALVRYIGSKLRRMDIELEKLSLYVTDRAVTHDDVYKLVPSVMEESIFVLTDALGKRDFKCAIDTLNRLIDQGDYPLMLLTMITRQLRLIWHVKVLKGKGVAYADLSRKAGYPPFLTGKYIKMADVFDADRLKKGFYCLADTDIRLKSGHNPRITLESLIMALCR